MYLPVNNQSDRQFKATAKTPSDAMTNFRSLVLSERSQISMAVGGEHGVQIRNFIKIIKLAFNYEAWDVFRRLSHRILAFIEAIDELHEKFKAELQIVQLLQAADKYLIHLRKLKHLKNEVVRANMAAAAKEKEEQEKKKEAAITATAAEPSKANLDMEAVKSRQPAMSGKSDMSHFKSKAMSMSSDNKIGEEGTESIAS